VGVHCAVCMRRRGDHSAPQLGEVRRDPAGHWHLYQRLRRRQPPAVVRDFGGFGVDHGLPARRSGLFYVDDDQVQFHCRDSACSNAPVRSKKKLLREAQAAARRDAARIYV
jgi:hypothetical protein